MLPISQARAGFCLQRVDALGSPPAPCPPTHIPVVHLVGGIGSMSWEVRKPAGLLSGRKHCELCVLWCLHGGQGVEDWSLSVPWLMALRSGRRYPVLCLLRLDVPVYNQASFLRRPWCGGPWCQWRRHSSRKLQICPKSSMG